MRAHIFIFFLIAAAFFSFPVKAETLTVKAEGAATGGDAKKTALENAIRDALSKAMKSLGAAVPQDTLTGEIQAAASRYLVNYKILSEGFSTDLMEEGTPIEGAPYRVVVEAAIDMEALKRDIFTAEELAFTKIVVLDVEDYATFEELKKSIEEIDMVRELLYDSFLKKRFRLKALSKGGRAELYERLSKTLSGGFTVAPEGEDSIVVRKKK